MNCEMKRLDWKIFLSKGWANSMQNLLKFEWRKLRKSKSFYICMGIMAGLLFLSAFTYHTILQTASEFVGITFMQRALNESSFTLVIGVFIAIFVCEDYEQQIVKNIYARGYSPKKVYIAKMISVWIAVSIMFLFVEIFGFLFGTMYFGTGEIDVTQIIGRIGIQYVIIMANTTLYYAMTSIIRKNGSSIAACMVVPMVVNMIFGIVDSLLRIEEISLTDFWISSFLSELTTLQLGSKRMLVCLLFSLLYIPLFLFVGFYKSVSDMR